MPIDVDCMAAALIPVRGLCRCVAGCGGCCGAQENRARYGWMDGWMDGWLLVL